MTPDHVLRIALPIFARPFVWGAQDCCTVACQTFTALHGQNPLAGFSEPYSNAAGAYRILSRAGGYLEWCRATFDLPECSPKSGDLVLMKNNDRLGANLAICIRAGSYLGKTETGMAITGGDILGAWTCRG